MDKLRHKQSREQKMRFKGYNRLTNNIADVNKGEAEGDDPLMDILIKNIKKRVGTAPFKSSV